MLFNSPEYIFIFLPIVFLVYFFLSGRRLIVAAKSWLVAASFFFYGYWEYKYLLLIITSILINYTIGSLLNRKRSQQFRTIVLVAGVAFNLGLLGYFKYCDFFIGNFNVIWGLSLPLQHLILPLAISFFTFQQLAYLVDSYKDGTKEYDFLHYCLFVTFFPQLIAGPIVRHNEMMPQFKNLRITLVNWDNIARGIFVFSIGLFKKVVIADSFAFYANSGFNSATSLSLFDAWAASLSYTMQIYYDFSGYSDMSIGAALIINIRLPINFNSPYKALSIQDFWRRWHMTLSHWLRDYLYIPLGGSRTNLLTFRNVLTTFFLGGLWHGASWTFVLWGLMHGIFLAINRLWQLTSIKLPRTLAWFLTFCCINLCFVIFRAETITQFLDILKSMAGLNGWQFPVEITNILNSFLPSFFSTAMPTAALISANAWLFLFFIGLATVLLPNSLELGGLLHRQRNFFTRNIGYGIATGVIAGTAATFMLMSTGTEFLYFNF